MAIKNWSTNYPGSQDPDPVTTNQPDLDDETAPGANDGDNILSEHVEVLRDKLHDVAKFVGDTGSLPSTSLRKRVTDLEGSVGSTFDHQRPIVVYNNASSYDVTVNPGQPAGTIKRTMLQDNKQRTINLTSVVNVDITTDLDTGFEAADTWYGIYLVPDPGDDDVLIPKFSTAGPQTGPTGFTEWELLGVVRNDSSSDFKEIRQVNDWQYYVDFTDLETELYTNQGTPAALTWFNMPLITTAAPTAFATAVEVGSFADSDPGGLHQVVVEPGNPPGWTPVTTFTVRGHAVLAAQGDAEDCNDFIRPIPDGTLSIAWLFRTGTTDVNCVIRGWQLPLKA